MPRCSGLPRGSAGCTGGAVCCGAAWGGGAALRTGAPGCSRCSLLLRWSLLPRCTGLPRSSAAGLASDALCGGCTVGGAACVGATTLTAGAGADGTAFKSFRAVSSSGLPGVAVSCGCCAAKPGCAAGGAVRATTGRSKTWAGGLLPGPASPRTLLSVGTIGAAIAKGVLATMFCVSGTAVLDTCCDWTNVVVGTAMMAPATSRLA